MRVRGCEVDERRWRCERFVCLRLADIAGVELRLDARHRRTCRLRGARGSTRAQLAVRPERAAWWDDGGLRLRHGLSLRCRRDNLCRCGRGGQRGSKASELRIYRHGFARRRCDTGGATVADRGGKRRSIPVQRDVDQAPVNRVSGKRRKGRRVQRR